MAARCHKITTKQLVARAEREAGRKLSTTERKSLDLLPPQYDCSGVKRITIDGSQYPTHRAAVAAVARDLRRKGAKVRTRYESPNDPMFNGLGRSPRRRSRKR
jgi:hypothetical protein